MPEWATMWGAKVKMPVDMPDDMLKDALETCSRVIDQYPDFENDGETQTESVIPPHHWILCHPTLRQQD